MMYEASQMLSTTLQPLAQTNHSELVVLRGLDEAQVNFIDSFLFESGPKTRIQDFEAALSFL